MDLVVVVGLGVVPVTQGGWTYRMFDDGGRQVQERTVDGWVPPYSISPEPVHAFDVEMANHFTATHPSSPDVTDHQRPVPTHPDSRPGPVEHRRGLRP